MLLASDPDRERRKRSVKTHANRGQHLANDIDHVSVTIAGEKNRREQNQDEMAEGDPAANAGVQEGLVIYCITNNLNEQKIAPIDLFI